MSTTPSATPSPSTADPCIADANPEQQGQAQPRAVQRLPYEPPLVQPLGHWQVHTMSEGLSGEFGGNG